MSGDRTPGRYGLHRLGFVAFEDLCALILRTVLGETCTRFLPGPDKGRDAWYQGTTSNKLLTQDEMKGSFLIQCKHTSTQHFALKLSKLKKELAKVQAFAKKVPINYILMTNARISSADEIEIREAFEKLEGVKKCLVRGETWIEDTVDAEPRLLRLVPRLYGIGDLSQILSSIIEQQTVSLLKDLAISQKTFVPTESYRRAEKVLSEHGFVVLVGPPSSGKSAIATSLSMVGMAQDSEWRVLKIEQTDQFKETWSPADRHTVYWVDDVFGETTLDEDRLKEWSQGLEKLEAARRRGVKIIFCTRDYILVAAELKLKKSKIDLLNDARVRVNVNDLSTEEREGILYNHIKDGDISKEQKTKLKPFLTQLATLRAFTPELARRLGDSRFHKGLVYGQESLKEFFENPVQHFRDVIHGLASAEKAALVTCLFNNNAVPDPIPGEALVNSILSTYDVTMAQVREAFELLEGSLVKRVRISTQQSWQVHHPSMIEALQVELAAKSSQLLLYLDAARLKVLLRDTSTLVPPADSRLVFLPASVYPNLISRLANADSNAIEAIAGYLLHRSSDEFLVELDKKCPQLLDSALAIVPMPEDAEVTAKLAVRLLRVQATAVLTSKRIELLNNSLSDALRDYGWMGFLRVEGLRELIPSFWRHALEAEISGNFDSFDRLYDWHREGENSKQALESTLDSIDAHASRLEKALSDEGLLKPESKAVLNAEKSTIQGKVKEMIREKEAEEAERADVDYDAWKEQQYESRSECEIGRFEDVDE